MRHEVSSPSNGLPGFDSSRKRLVLPVLLNWLLIGYTALTLAGGWAYTALHIKADRERTLQAERDRLLTMASALETATGAMLNDGVGAAVAGARELGSFADPVPDDMTVHGTLQRMLTGGKYVHSLFLIAHDRFARASRSDYESGRQPPLWFSTTRAGPTQDEWVGSPTIDPVQPHGTVIPIAHQVQLSGNQRVWAGGLFDFGETDALYGRFQGSSSSLALLSQQGEVLSFIPDVTKREIALGTQLADSPMFQSVPTDSKFGVVQGFAPRFGTEVLFAYHRLNNYPITVVTGEPVDTLLAGWRERTHTALVVTAGSSALLLLMTGLLDRAVRVLRRRELHYRTLFNSATFSVLLLENDRFVAANHTALRMFGLGPQGTAVGLTPWDLSPEYQSDGRQSETAARERIAVALREGGTTFEWCHKRMDTGESFAAQVDLSTLKTGRTTLALAVVHDLTERKRAERERWESEQRYRALVDALPEAVYVHRGNEVLFVNQAALELMRASSPQDLLGKPVLSFAPEATREALAHRIRTILETGSADAQEVLVRRLDGSLMWAELQGVRIQFAGAPAVQSVLHDITARKARQEAEAARADRMQCQSTALLRLTALTASGAPDISRALRAVCRTAGEVLRVDRIGIWLLDTESVNVQCADCYDGRERRDIEVPAVSLEHSTLRLDALRHERVIETANLAGDLRLRELIQLRAGLPQARSVIAAAIRSSGELTGVLAFEQVEAERAWHTDEVTFAAGVADQVAQLLIAAKREELLQDLHTLAGELVRVQDEERRRIGRDLHDSTGQTLTALELDLAHLADSAQQLSPEQSARLTHCVELASQCAAEIRSASYLLHPPLLDELGLVSALHWLADGLRQRSEIDIRLDLQDASSRCEPEEELTLFRVAQEALTNVLRHAQSPWVAIRLRSDTEAIRLEVEDGGRGLAHARTTLNDGLHGSVGLTGMRERIRQIGGSFEIESTATGTLIAATLHARRRPRGVRGVM